VGGAPACNAASRRPPHQLQRLLHPRTNPIQEFLGEGGKKKAYLAHDTLLDREVAFALIKNVGEEIGN
jgi:hypothetical protein